LAELRAQKVKIFSAPFFGSQKCGSEWQQFGTCCEETSLKAYVSKDSRHLVSLYHMMIRELKLAVEEMTRFEDGLRNLQTKPDIAMLLNNDREADGHHQSKSVGEFLEIMKIAVEPIDDLTEDSSVTNGQESNTENKMHSVQGRQTGPNDDRSQPTQDQKINWAEDIPNEQPSDQHSTSEPDADSHAAHPATSNLTEEMRQELLTLVAEAEAITKNFSEVRRSFPKKYESCARETIKLRSSAVCTICSGRGRSALDNGKLKVSEDTCSEFIQTCFDSWTMLIQIMNGMKRGKAIADKLQTIHQHLEFPYRGHFVDAISAWLNVTGLEKKLLHCSGDAHVCPIEFKQGVCGAVLNVEQPTFLEDVVELVVKGRVTVTPAEIKKFDRIKTPINGNQPPVKQAIKINLQRKGFLVLNKEKKIIGYIDISGLYYSVYR
jgi:hypothetical protein